MRNPQRGTITSQGITVCVVSHLGHDANDLPAVFADGGGDGAHDPVVPTAVHQLDAPQCKCCAQCFTSVRHSPGQFACPRESPHAATHASGSHRSTMPAGRASVRRPRATRINRQCRENNKDERSSPAAPSVRRTGPRCKFSSGADSGGFNPHATPRLTVSGKRRSTEHGHAVGVGKHGEVRLGGGLGATGPDCGHRRGEGDADSHANQCACGYT